jgi:hypothetical protein
VVEGGWTSSIAEPVLEQLWRRQCGYRDVAILNVTSSGLEVSSFMHLALLRLVNFHLDSCILCDPPVQRQSCEE